MRPLHAVLATLTCLLLGGAASAATFVVNSDDDDADLNAGDGLCATGQFIVISIVPFTTASECTLRAAIQESNALSGTDTIEFNGLIPQISGVVEIVPATPLTWISDTVLIDGYSHPDYDVLNPDASPEINLRGTAITGGASGLVFLPGSSNSTVRGLAISGFESAGITVSPFFGPAPSNLRIEGNHLGVWRGVFYGSGNGEDGLVLSSSNNNRIGVTCAGVIGCTGRRNVISGNGRHGIYVTGTSSGNRIGGNYIGLDRLGNATSVPFGGATRNAEWGVFVDTNATNNDVGVYYEWAPLGTVIQTYAAGNTISGNGAGGVRLEGDGNAVYANLIGTNAAGTFARPNLGAGVSVVGDDNTIGNQGIGRNVISGNAGSGVALVSMSGFDPLRTEIVGNLIGVDADGDGPLGNQSSGVYVWGNDGVIRGNVIGGNAAAGITDHSYSGSIESNYIGTNAAGDDLGNGLLGIGLYGGHVVVGGPGTGNTVGFNPVGISAGGSSYEITVQGNWVGTNASGADLGNDTIGIQMASAEYAVGGAGGLTNGLGNVVGWNRTIGIAARGIGGTVSGNYVGTNASGDVMGNGSHGIEVETAVGLSTSVGASLSTLPSDVPGMGNRVAYNAGAGVAVDGTEEVAVRGNQLYGHQVQPIDLGDDGETPNDFGDLDGGDNLTQNYPILDGGNTFLNLLNGDIQVRYAVASDPGAAAYPLTIDFYIHDPWLEPGDEARAWVGTDQYAAGNAYGYRTVSITPPSGVMAPNLYGFVFEGLRATATDANGNTSELTLNPVPVPEPGFAAGIATALVGLAAGCGRRRATRR